MASKRSDELKQSSLHDYLTGQHREMTDRMGVIDQALLGIAFGLKMARQEKSYWGPEWPGAPSDGASISASTQAMCLVACRDLAPSLDASFKKEIGFDDSKWLETARRQLAPSVSNGKVASSTYGSNSPVVINWLLRAKLISRNDARKLVRGGAVLNKCLKTPEQHSPITQDDNDAGQHAFPLLGAVQLAKALGWPKDSLRITGRLV